MKAGKPSNPPAVSLQELLENETRISQRLLIELACAQTDLASARERLEIVRAEIEGRLTNGEETEQGPLVAVRTTKGIAVVERSELRELSKAESRDIIPF